MIGWINIKHKKDNPPAEEDMNLENSANFAAYESGKAFFGTITNPTLQLKTKIRNYK